MSREVYRYIFDRSVPFAEVLSTLDLAMIAVESLHGESRARMDARFVGSPAAHVLVIDASTHVGQALNQVFVGYARHEFGETAFTLTRVPRVRDKEMPCVCAAC